MLPSACNVAPVAVNAAGDVVHGAATGAEGGVEHAASREADQADGRDAALAPTTLATPTYLPSVWRRSFFGYSVIPEPVIESTVCPAYTERRVDRTVGVVARQVDLLAGVAAGPERHDLAARGCPVRRAPPPSRR